MYSLCVNQDTTVRIWDVLLGKVVMVLSGHTHSVTGIKWGGEGLIYTASQDRNIKVWRAKDVSFFVYEHVCLDFPSLPLSSGSIVPHPTRPRPLGKHNGPQHRLQSSYSSI